MPIFSWSARGDVPPVGDPAFDGLLAGNLLPEDTAGGLRPVAEVIAALNAPPVTSELAAEASALRAFRAAGRSGEPARSRPRRHPLLTSLLSAKLAAAAAAAAAVGLGGAAAAAYVGALPAPAQKVAHDILGAPSAHPTPSATPVGPDATGPAAFGLCTAFAHLKAHGSAAEQAVAFRNLATAAGGAAEVTAFCAKVAHPGTTPSAEPTTHPTGKPSTLPSQVPTGRPSGKPTTHPTGRPSTLPSQVPTGRPSGKPTATR